MPQEGMVAARFWRAKDFRRDRPHLCQAALGLSEPLAPRLRLAKMGVGDRAPGAGCIALSVVKFRREGNNTGTMGSSSGFLANQ